jgi:hypothetical protein
MTPDLKLHRMALAGVVLWIGAAAPSVAQPSVTQPSVAQQRVVIELSVAEPGARKQFPTVRVQRGDVVVLRLSTDAALEFHLHGYDVTARGRPGEPAELRFVAVVTGRFAVEAHTPAGHRRLGYVEVHPR